MVRKLLPVVCVAMGIGIALSACTGGATPTPAMMMDHADHMMVHPTPPTEYADKINPFAGKVEAAAEGGQLFQANCSSCHGLQGKGDGVAAASLEPKPANLAAVQRDLSDAYLFWRISEGGVLSPFNSLMPAWKSLLSEEQIWQIVTFLRTLE